MQEGEVKLLSPAQKLMNAMIYSALKDLRARRAEDRLSARRWLLDLGYRKDYFLSVKHCCLSLELPHERVIRAAAIIDAVNKREAEKGRRETSLSSFEIIKETVEGPKALVEAQPKRKVGRPKLLR